VSLIELLVEKGHSLLASGCGWERAKQVRMFWQRRLTMDTMMLFMLLEQQRREHVREVRVLKRFFCADSLLGIVCQ